MKLKKLLEHTLGELPSDKLMKMKWNPLIDEGSRPMRPSVEKLLKQKGYAPIFQAIDKSKRQFKQMRYTKGEIEDTLFDMFGNTDPKIVKKIMEAANEVVSSLTEELGEKLEMPSVHSEFNMLIKDLNKLGGAKLNAVRKIKKDGDKEVVGKGTISPKSVGFFGQAFKKIDYEATALYGENGKGSNLYQALVLVIQFSYEHERGSNGYTLRYKWDNANPRWKRVD